jgi:NADP-dependent aldehyde dehydrogenase
VWNLPFTIPGTAFSRLREWNESVRSRITRHQAAMRAPLSSPLTQLRLLERLSRKHSALIIIVRYSTQGDLQQALLSVPPSLTASIHSAETDRASVVDLIALVQPRTGRLVFDGYPTGVRVSWGQHHGGPWPSTNTLHTSVGVSSMRRFLRPVAWQNAPSYVLPDELHDGYLGIPRRIDGFLHDSQP